jgi:hypothetical protein
LGESYGAVPVGGEVVHLGGEVFCGEDGAVELLGWGEELFWYQVVVDEAEGVLGPGGCQGRVGEEAQACCGQSGDGEPGGEREFCPGHQRIARGWHAIISRV